MSEFESNIRSLRGPILVTGASGFVGANLFTKISTIRDDVYAVGATGLRLAPARRPGRADPHRRPQ